MRRIDVQTKHVFWNDSGSLCCLASDSAFFVLQHDKEAVSTYLESGTLDEDEGCEGAFEPVYEVSEKVGA